MLVKSGFGLSLIINIYIKIYLKKFNYILNDCQAFIKISSIQFCLYFRLQLMQD